MYNTFQASECSGEKFRSVLRREAAIVADAERNRSGWRQTPPTLSLQERPKCCQINGRRGLLIQRGVNVVGW